MSVTMRRALFAICLVALGCGDTATKPEGESDDFDAGTTMSSGSEDSGAGAGKDAGESATKDAGTTGPMDAGMTGTLKDAGTIKDAGMMTKDAGPQLPAGDWIDVGQGPKTVDASKTKCGLKLDGQVLFRAAATDLTVGVAFDGNPMVADYAVVDFYKSPYGANEAGSVARITGTDYDSVGGGTVKYLGGNPIRLQVLGAVMKSTGGVSRTVSAQFTCPAGTTLRASLQDDPTEQVFDRSTARALLVE